MTCPNCTCPACVEEQRRTADAAKFREVFDVLERDGVFANPTTTGPLRGFRLDRAWPIDDSPWVRITW